MMLVKQILSILGLTIFVLAAILLFGILLLQLRQLFPIDTPTPTRREVAEEKKTPPYLRAEEAVAVPHKTVLIATSSSAASATATPPSPPLLLSIKPVLFEYVEVTDSCGAHFEGDCLNVRSGPGTDFPSIAKLRNGIVLKINGQVETASTTWYKIVFDEWLRYPERVEQSWYVAADYVTVLFDEGNKAHDGVSTTTKRILVDRSEQKLYAFDGESLFMETTISTGIELTPTPRGTFTIFKKTPSRYMQGPLPYLAISKYYDLPGVPWNLYFTEQGAVIHGAYWHNSFGSPYSSGCVNMKPSEAHELYSWAELGTTVTVRD